MQRITTDTVDADKHGAGKDGFTDGDAGAGTPPTRLNADWFDAVQEEIANAIEGRGVALDEATNLQLHRVIATSPEHMIKRGVANGLTYVPTVGRAATLQAGTVYYAGRRYHISAAAITALATESPRTFTASRDTYVVLTPTSDTAFTIAAREVTVGAAAPTISSNEVVVAVVTTDASAITNVENAATIGDVEIASVQLGTTARRPVAAFPGGGRCIEKVVRVWVTNTTSNVDATLLLASEFPAESVALVICDVVGISTTNAITPQTMIMLARPFGRNGGGIVSSLATTEVFKEFFSTGHTVEPVVSGSTVVLRHTLASTGDNWLFVTNVRIILTERTSE